MPLKGIFRSPQRISHEPPPPIVVKTSSKPTDLHADVFIPASKPRVVSSPNLELDIKKIAEEIDSTCMRLTIRHFDVDHFRFDREESTLEILKWKIDELDGHATRDNKQLVKDGQRILLEKLNRGVINAKFRTLERRLNALQNNTQDRINQSLNVDAHRATFHVKVDGYSRLEFLSDLEFNHASEALIGTDFSAQRRLNTRIWEFARTEARKHEQEYGQKIDLSKIARAHNEASVAVLAAQQNSDILKDAKANAPRHDLAQQLAKTSLEIEQMMRTLQTQRVPFEDLLSSNGDINALKIKQTFDPLDALFVQFAVELGQFWRLPQRKYDHDQLHMGALQRQLNAQRQDLEGQHYALASLIKFSRSRELQTNLRDKRAFFDALIKIGLPIDDLETEIVENMVTMCLEVKDAIHRERRVSEQTQKKLDILKSYATNIEAVIAAMPRLDTQVVNQTVILAKELIYTPMESVDQ